SPINFVVFFIGSIFLITLIYGGVMLFRKQKNTLIPLAGAMSLVLIAVLLVQQFTTSFHLYQDLFIINELRQKHTTEYLNSANHLYRSGMALPYCNQKYG